MADKRKSKLIHAELKCGMHVKCLWLGNDAFAKLFESWDFDSDEGKFKGLAEFDSTFSYTFDFDELKDEKDLIGIDVEEGLKDAEIVSYDIEDINWQPTKKTYIRLAIVDVVIPNKEDIEITSVIATDNFGNTHETCVDFFVCLEDEDGEEIS
tara:strand:- start:47 stop:505 length:459 start_codon:yes stop_codon:yes gene_type:complete